jgi:YggT family protein
MVIARAFLFFTWAVQLAIVAIIVLMVLRLIADAADLNPFGWASRTIRRLTDGLVFPVRGSLRDVGIDPKFAALVVILVSILLGYFIVRVLATISSTLEGVILSITRGDVIASIGFILYGLISLYILALFVRIIFSWGMISYQNRVMRFLVNLTEPLLGPLRRVIPPLGRIDISPLIAFLILFLFQAAIAGTLLRGAVNPTTF